MQRGFSLIELMVVIAIVAVLSAVALPAYKNYTIRVKVASAMPVLEKFKQQQLDYYAKNGIFANAVTLGLGTVGSLVTNPTSYSPYAANFHINQYCRTDGMMKPTAEIGIVLNSTALGYSGTQLWYQLLLTDEGNGHITSNCYYRADGGLTNTLVAPYLPSNCQTTAPGTYSACT